MNDEELLSRIKTDPSFMSGKPTVRGLRITVEQIVRRLGEGTGEQELLREFSFLEPDDVRAALLYASRLTTLSRMSGEAVAEAARNNRVLSLESRGMGRICEVIAELPDDLGDLITPDGPPQKREGL